jgi:hypothetical protein
VRLAYLALLIASPAYAGRTVYGWLPQTDTLPDGAMELETSLYEHDNLGPFHERAAFLAWTPAIGLTPCLELAVPIELDTITADDAAASSGMSRYGAELRYRFLPHSSPLRAVARFGVFRDVPLQSDVGTEAAVAASYDIDRVQVAADLDDVLDINFGHLHDELRPSFGASAGVTGELRLGAEIHAEVSFDPTVSSWAAIGPDIAWARGRFWLSGAFGIGIRNITAAPRLNVGMDW